MKLKSLLISILIIHVFAFGISWILMHSPPAEDSENDSAAAEPAIVYLPSDDLAYPVFAFFGKSYLRRNHHELVGRLKLDSLEYSGWNPNIYRAFQRQYTDVYSFENLGSWKP